MKQIQIGDLTMRTRGDKLVLQIQEARKVASTEIDVEDLQLITEFIRTHRESCSNRHRGYRLSLDKLASGEAEQLLVTVQTGAKPLPVIPTDLSITGIRVQSDTLEALPGMQAIVNIRFEQQDVALQAILVRCFDDNTGFAFHFPEVFSEDGRLTPPQALTEIIYALESLWLEQNLDLKWNLA
ncbi:MAG: PilZ domain-containing protein [Parahaliea sp.]